MVNLFVCSTVLSVRILNTDMVKENTNHLHFDMKKIVYILSLFSDMSGQILGLNKYCSGNLVQANVVWANMGDVIIFKSDTKY